MSRNALVGFLVALLALLATAALSIELLALLHRIATP